MSIILPKTDKEGNYYLSYSQYSTWKKSKRDYIRQYFLGESFDGNEYTDFGKTVGEALEQNDFSLFTVKEQRFLKKLPRYDIFEQEIKLQLDGFYIKGFIDSSKLVDNESDTGPKKLVTDILDYKTGDISSKRFEYDSDKYIQLQGYGAALSQVQGFIPKAKVVLIQRDGNPYKNEPLTLGNDFIEIEQDMSSERIEEVKQEFQKIAEEISEYYTIFLKLNRLI